MAVFLVKDKRTRKAAHDLIMDMAKHGSREFERHYGYRFKTNADVKRFFADIGRDFNDVQLECRDKDALLPFENRLGGGWTFNSGGGENSYASYTDFTGYEHDLGSESGWFHVAAYWALFDQAVEELERSINTGVYRHFLSCASNGVGSIEAFLGAKVEAYNRRHPEKALIDSKQKKVSFDDRVDQWIPMMTRGKKLDKNNQQRWQHFKELRKLRDTQQAHSKETVMRGSYKSLGLLLNRFRTGIAGLLLELHIVFGDKAPPTVVRHAYLPDIEFVGVPA